MLYVCFFWIENKRAKKFPPKIMGKKWHKKHRKRKTTLREKENAKRRQWTFGGPPQEHQYLFRLCRSILICSSIHSRFPHKGILTLLQFTPAVMLLLPWSRNRYCAHNTVSCAHGSVRWGVPIIASLSSVTMPPLRASEYSIAHRHRSIHWR